MQLHFNLLALRDDPLPALQTKITEAQSKGQNDYASTLLQQVAIEEEKRGRWTVRSSHPLPFVSGLSFLFVFAFFLVLFPLLVSHLLLPRFPLYILPLPSYLLPFLFIPFRRIRSLTKPPWHGPLHCSSRTPSGGTTTSGRFTPSYKRSLPQTS